MYTETKNVVFYNGAEYEFQFAFNENSSIFSADDAKVTFTLENSAEKDLLNASVEEVSIPFGTYTSPVWDIGDVSASESELAIFKLVITSDTVKYAKVIVTAETTSNEKILKNNIGEFIFEPIDRTSIEHVVEETVDESVSEVPSSAFADSTAPTTAEVQTWAEANLTDFQLKNGTHLTYNSNPYTEDITWEDISITLDVSGESTIGSFYFNKTSVDITSVNDVTSSANFDETGFKAAIDAEFANEGIIGTVVITDNIDSSSEVVISITNQTGIWYVRTYTGTKYYYPSTLTKTTVTGRKTPDHIWVINNSGGTNTVTKIYQANQQYNNNNLYSSQRIFVNTITGSDENGEIGDPDRPFKTLEYVTGRLLTNEYSSIVCHINEGLEPFYIQYINLQFSTLKLYCDARTRNMTPASAIFIREHSTSGSGRIVVEGRIHTRENSPGIEGIENCGYRQLVLKDLTIYQESSLGSSPILGASSGPIEVVCMNVKTNQTTDINANIVEVGESIFRSPDIVL